MSYERLLKEVISNSDANTWQDAVGEWDITDMWEDDTCSTSCICGHENIKYCFVISNHNNDNIIQPIGSSCIRKFKRKELSDIVTIHEQLFKLRNAIETHKFSIKNYSRKLIDYLYHEDFLTYQDYSFLLDKFNQRSELTKNEDKKVYAITMSDVIPFIDSKNDKKKININNEDILSLLTPVSKQPSLIKDVPDDVLDSIKTYIPPSQWNNFNPEQDLEFLKDVKKGNITERQGWKIKAILHGVIDALK